MDAWMHGYMDAWKDVDGWMGGWMDGREGGREGGMDGCCVTGEGATPPPQCRPILPRQGLGNAQSYDEILCCLVAWFVGCLFGFFAWPRCFFVGWSVGGHSVGGWMHGWMLGCLASRRSFRRFASFRIVSAQFPEGSEGLVPRSFGGDNYGLCGCTYAA